MCTQVSRSTSSWWVGAFSSSMMSSSKYTGQRLMLTVSWECKTYRPCGWAVKDCLERFSPDWKSQIEWSFFNRDWKCPRLPRTNKWMNRMNRMSMNNKCAHFITVNQTSLTLGDCLPSPTFSFPKALMQRSNDSYELCTQLHAYAWLSRALFSQNKMFFEEPSLAQRNITSHFTNLDLPKIYIYIVYYVRQVNKLIQWGEVLLDVAFLTTQGALSFWAPVWSPDQANSVERALGMLILLRSKPGIFT